MPDEPHILTNVDEHGVMLVTINRPEVMNALSVEMMALLGEAIGEASERDDVYAMVLTGAGRGFCAGAEIGGPGGDSGEPSRHQRVDRRGGSRQLAMAFSESDVPIIGAINGPAVGAGFGIALCCDVRLMADSARMGSIFIKRGLAADYGAAYWLPRLVGISKAHELFYSGDLLNAEQCVEWGIREPRRACRPARRRGPGVRPHDRQRPADGLHRRAAHAPALDRHVDDALPRVRVGDAADAARQRGRQGGLPRLRRASRPAVPGPLTPEQPGEEPR